jgi:hypothetical protein
MYRTIDPECWIDKKVRQLEAEVKLLWVYLITNSHTHLSGLYYLPIPFIIHETGLTDKSVRRGLKALNEALMIYYDDENELIWIVNMLKRQKGVTAKNRNAWVSIVNQLTMFSHSELVNLFMNKYNDLGLPFEVPDKPLASPLSRDLVIVTDIVKDIVKDIVIAPVIDSTKAEISIEAQQIGREFYDYIMMTFKGSKIKLDQQIEAAQKLIDKYSLKSLRTAIKVVQSDKFFAQNVRSLLKLDEHWEKRGRVWILEVLLKSKPEYPHPYDDPEYRARQKAENKRAAEEAR